MANVIPRTPTRDEYHDLAHAFTEHMGLPYGEAKEDLSSASIAVFDTYTTDCPGYSGKIACVIFSGGPEIVYTVIWAGGTPTVVATPVTL